MTCRATHTKTPSEECFTRSPSPQGSGYSSPSPLSRWLGSVLVRTQCHRQAHVLLARVMSLEQNVAPRSEPVPTSNPADGS